MASILPPLVVIRLLECGMPRMDITCVPIQVIPILCARLPGLLTTNDWLQLLLTKQSRFGKSNEMRFSLLFHACHQYSFSSDLTLHQIFQSISYLLYRVSS